MTNPIPPAPNTKSITTISGMVTSTPDFSSFAVHLQMTCAQHNSLWCPGYSRAVSGWWGGCTSGSKYQGMLQSTQLNGEYQTVWWTATVFKKYGKDQHLKTLPAEGTKLSFQAGAEWLTQSPLVGNQWASVGRLHAVASSWSFLHLERRRSSSNRR